MITVNMRPGSKAYKCLQILSDGPATTAEIAVEMGVTSHNAASHMKNLHLRGIVCREEFLRRKSQRRKIYLWSLPDADTLASIQKARRKWHWTQEEDDILRCRYRRDTAITIARDLNRKPVSVYRRIAKLGLNKPIPHREVEQ